MRLHWEKGGPAGLAAMLGSAPSEPLISAIEVLEVASSKARDWAMKNPEKGH